MYKSLVKTHFTYTLQMNEQLRKDNYSAFDASISLKKKTVILYLKLEAC